MKNTSDSAFVPPASPACGYVAVIGAPNAGKSTLVNRFAGGKVAIVTHKAQTTRDRLRAIAQAGDTQLIYIDTPGIFTATGAFEKKMVEEAWAAVKEADAVLFIVDAEKGLSEAAQGVAEKLKKLAKPVALALNKVDAVHKPYLLKLATLFDAYGFARIFMVSALKGVGVDDMQTWLASHMPAGPWLYAGDQLTDRPWREIAAEITREKLFLQLSQELPYSLAVETESWEERRGGTVAIAQSIIVERESQKKIVIGEGGATLKRIGILARKELEEQLEKKVYLSLFVKVDAKWKEKRG